MFTAEAVPFNEFLIFCLLVFIVEVSIDLVDEDNKLSDDFVSLIKDDFGAVSALWNDMLLGPLFAGIPKYDNSCCRNCRVPGDNLGIFFLSSDFG